MPSDVTELVVDLRSDTVTRPSPEMRRAIAEAEVGDAVLGDDPTAAALERHAAEVLGKERALFFPSGVMANTAA
ncbi:MAG TPA: beta-eliminating lyase-related protein, partial [Longimicrobium sp.]|nr:beta-eliminating lyase-related protein [Longimicrobium sp.]